MILKPSSSSSRRWFSIYSRIVFSSTRAHRRAEGPPRPQVLPPVLLPQSETLPAAAATISPSATAPLWPGQMRRYRQQHVDVVRRHRPPHDHQLPGLATLPDQVARTFRDSPHQYLATVFCDPDHVILDVEDRVRAVPVFRHSLSVVKGDSKWTA